MLTVIGISMPGTQRRLLSTGPVHALSKFPHSLLQPEVKHCIPWCVLLLSQSGPMNACTPCQNP
eukprot:354832-Amphidinium_carterae.2